MIVLLNIIDLVLILAESSKRVKDLNWSSPGVHSFISVLDLGVKFPVAHLDTSWTVSDRLGGFSQHPLRARAFQSRSFYTFSKTLSLPADLDSWWTGQASLSCFSVCFPSE